MPSDVKEATIKPDDFQIAEKAVKYHGITQESALQNGRCLANVLDDFMRDVSMYCSLGAQLCAHHFEFDAGIIKAELQRCGSDANLVEWERIARNGYCSWNPDAGRWLRQCAGKDFGLSTTKNVLGFPGAMGSLGL